MVWFVIARTGTVITILLLHKWFLLSSFTHIIANHLVLHRAVVSLIISWSWIIISALVFWSSSQSDFLWIGPKTFVILIIVSWSWTAWYILQLCDSSFISSFTHIITNNLIFDSSVISFIMPRSWTIVSTLFFWSSSYGNLLWVGTNLLIVSFICSWTNVLISLWWLHESLLCLRLAHIVTYNFVLHCVSICFIMTWSWT